MRETGVTVMTLFFLTLFSSIYNSFCIKFFSLFLLRIHLFLCISVPVTVFSV